MHELQGTSFCCYHSLFIGLACAPCCDRLWPSEMSARCGLCRGSCRDIHRRNSCPAWLSSMYHKHPTQQLPDNSLHTAFCICSSFAHLVFVGLQVTICSFCVRAHDVIQLQLHACMHARVHVRATDQPNDQPTNQHTHTHGGLDGAIERPTSIDIHESA